jgi:large conductance mechanosensitive channel
MKKLFKEFKEFINKGNAFDLAVGLVIGTAFNAIVKSLVNDIIMPLISVIVKTDITKLYIVLKGTATYDEVTGSLILSENAVLLTYGNFLQTIVNFFVIALSIFFAIKVITKLHNSLENAKELIFGDTEEEKEESIKE